MYAVVNSGGKQYKVQQGQVLRIEKIPGDVGNPVTFEQVLMFSDGENVSIGQPALKDIAVEGHIVEQGKAKNPETETAAPKTEQTKMAAPDKEASKKAETTVATTNTSTSEQESK